MGVIFRFSLTSLVCVFCLWKKQWLKQEEFYDLLTSQLREIKLAGNCGLLMPFVMSHGSQGALHDKDGRRIFINNILHQVTHHIGDKVPLISVRSMVEDGC